MKQFKKILVGVDLSAGDRYVSEELRAPTVEAIERAIWLAESNEAEIVFLYVLDVSPQTQHLIEHSAEDERTVVDSANEALADIVERARAKSVSARATVVLGKSWVEIIREVLRNGHDLVVVGTSHKRSINTTLFGSTGIKLLRKCPCPVWITQPIENIRFRSILVANDLTAVGKMAMHLGCSMATMHEANLHVLHAIQRSEEELVFPSRARQQQLQDLQQTAEEEIGRQLEEYGRAGHAAIHITEEVPDEAIIDYIQQHDIELLIMGTIARAGIQGVLTGNTAERLLPRIPCSVVAIKPDDFKTPITL